MVTEKDLQALIESAQALVNNARAELKSTQERLAAATNEANLMQEKVTETEETVKALRKAMKIFHGKTIDERNLSKR